MTTFVLVPGFWAGAWIWRRVTDDLRRRGHDVYPISLTGLAERVHLARPDTDLEVHVTDVLNLLKYEDLRDVILVGHSYGGLVVTGVADRAPDRVALLAYVDSGPLPDGFCQNDFNSPEGQEENAKEVTEAGDGWRLPPPAWAVLAESVPEVDEAGIAWLAERAVPHPWASAITPVRLTSAWEKIPRLGILSSFTTEQVRELASSVPMFRHMGGDLWRYEELPTWHWPMVSRPRELAELLHPAASAGPTAA
jgi:pimeloyl-ACP methyl ester carboxylesterase